MPYVKDSDLPVIAQTYTKLIKNSDQKRLQFSNTVLTIYSVVTSGLVALASTLNLMGTVEKISFLVIVTSAVLIVASALVERFGYFLINEEIAKTYVKHINETGEHLVTPMGGKDWHNRLIVLCTWSILILLILNLFAVIVYIYSSVLS